MLHYEYEEKLVVGTCPKIKIESQENFQEYFQEHFFLRNRAPVKARQSSLATARTNITKACAHFGSLSTVYTRHGRVRVRQGRASDCR